jgi:hypothetical protein
VEDPSSSSTTRRNGGISSSQSGGEYPTIHIYNQETRILQPPASHLGANEEHIELSNIARELQGLVSRVTPPAPPEGKSLGH